MKQLTKYSVLATLGLLISTSSSQGASITFSPNGAVEAKPNTDISLAVIVDPGSVRIRDIGFTINIIDTSELALRGNNGSNRFIYSNKNINTISVLDDIRFRVIEVKVDNDEDVRIKEVIATDFDGKQVNVFRDGSVNIVPEPLTILGSGLAIGFGTWLKRDYAKRCKKT